MRHSQGRARVEAARPVDAENAPTGLAKPQTVSHSSHTPYSSNPVSAARRTAEPVRIIGHRPTDSAEEAYFLGLLGIALNSGLSVGRRVVAQQLGAEESRFNEHRANS